VDRAAAAAILARLHAAQGAFYAGGDGADTALRAVLDPAIEWHVPGRNAIAGDYRGIEAVMAYFARRRAHAARTFRMHPGDILTGDGDRVAVLTDGEATIAGRVERWSTVGLYRLTAERVAGCWLLPLDPEAFDRIWA
jgi:ketosteroid isomerase-like protein